MSIVAELVRWIRIYACLCGWRMEEPHGRWPDGTVPDEPVPPSVRCIGCKDHAPFYRLEQVV